MTNDWGSWCNTFFAKSPFIINCDYPSGYEMLNHIYNDIHYADSTEMIPANVCIYMKMITNMLLLESFHSADGI